MPRAVSFTHEKPTCDRQSEALERIATAAFEALAEKHAQRRAEVLHALTKCNPAYEEARDA